MRVCESGEQQRAGMQSERDRDRERGSWAANAGSRLFSVMTQNDISMIRERKPAKSLLRKSLGPAKGRFTVSANYSVKSSTSCWVQEQTSVWMGETNILRYQENDSKNMYLTFTILTSFLWAPTAMLPAAVHVVRTMVPTTLFEQYLPLWLSLHSCHYSLSLLI